MSLNSFGDTISKVLKASINRLLMTTFLFQVEEMDFGQIKKTNTCHIPFDNLLIMHKRNTKTNTNNW